MKPVFVFLAALAAAHAADYKLTSSPGTVVWGNYWAGAKPVLRIQSGDTVEILTMSTSSPAALARVGVKDADIQPEWKAISANQPPRDQRGPGGHVLTNVALFAPNIEIPLHPFFGSMGVAPDPSKGKLDSAPPGDHAGNLDNKDLVEGTILYIPVHAPGALFEVGDGHAGQGNGEVDITAMETSLVGTFQFVVRKDMKLQWPFGETPTHWIAMGLDKDLTQALILAVRQAIDFLVTEKHMTREDAYALCSVAVDFNVTQAVDGTKGIHAMIPKSIFK